MQLKETDVRINQNYLDVQMDIFYIYLSILSLFYFDKNYTTVIKTILFTMSIQYKIKISHGIIRIYLHRRPIWAMKTCKIYITKVIKPS